MTTRGSNTFLVPSTDYRILFLNTRILKGGGRGKERKKERKIRRKKEEEEEEVYLKTEASISLFGLDDIAV